MCNKGPTFEIKDKLFLCLVINMSVNKKDHRALTSQNKYNVYLWFIVYFGIKKQQRFDAYVRKKVEVGGGGGVGVGGAGVPYNLHYLSKTLATGKFVQPHWWLNNSLFVCKEDGQMKNRCNIFLKKILYIMNKLAAE